MSRSPLRTLRGALACVLLAVNTVAAALPLFVLALVKFLLPFTPVQRAVRSLMHAIAENWIRINGLWQAGIRWDVQGLEGCAVTAPTWSPATTRAGSTSSRCSIS